MKHSSINRAFLLPVLCYTATGDGLGVDFHNTCYNCKKERGRTLKSTVDILKVVWLSDKAKNTELRKKTRIVQYST